MRWLLYVFEKYTEFIEVFIQRQSVLAPLLLLLVEEAGVPILIPGDAVLAYTGYHIQTSHQSSLWLAIVMAVLAVLIGSSILFFIARKYGTRFVALIGRFIFLKPRHLEQAEHFFKRCGVWTIIFGRHIPGMRIPITIFAAVSGVRYRTFILCTFISTSLWIWLYLALGKRYGADIGKLVGKSTLVTAGVVIGIVIVFIGLHIHGVNRTEHSSD